MKILTIAKLKDAALTMPPAVMLPIMEASVAEMNKQKKEGKVVEWYYSPGTFQSVVILDYDSADQWTKDQAKIPILAYCDSEVYPLANYEAYLKGMVEAMKAAAKMMPGPK
jgi:muconolactone delta-isomerase